MDFSCIFSDLSKTAENPIIEPLKGSNREKMQKRDKNEETRTKKKW